MFALPFLLAVAMLGQSSSPFAQQVVVRKVTLNGVSQLTPSEQQEIVGKIQKAYGITSFSQVDDQLREAIQSQGFYKAWVSQPQITVASGSEQDGTVDLAFDVREGQRYRLKNITFTNNHAFSSGQLRQAIPMSDGAFFSTAEARKGFEQLRKLYVNRGYIDFVPFPELVVDEQEAAITMQVDLSEGVPFRVGTLAFDGVDATPETTAKLRQAWKKYQGRIYSNDLMPNFMRENAAYLPQSESDKQRFRIVVDDEAHVLHFRLDLRSGNAPSVSSEP